MPDQDTLSEWMLALDREDIRRESRRDVRRQPATITEPRDVTTRDFVAAAQPPQPR